VRGVGTLEAYLSRPIGQYLWGPTFVVWWRSPNLNGIMFWGRPEEEHVQHVMGALAGEFRSGVRPHASLIDVRRVSVIDLGAFTALLRFSREHRDEFGRIVTGQAYLRADGLTGATVAGFPEVLDPAFPTKVFTDPVAALAWLGADDEIAVIDELDEIHATASGGSAFVAGLRAHLEASPRARTLGDTARAFGLSSRQMQRKLRDAHTTFQFEQNAARMRVAKTLLLETNYDLKRVAIEIGSASLQNFSALFHKSTGESPSQWRSRQRPGDFPARSASRSGASER
jgi:AraC-like DNA-binding protein